MADDHNSLSDWQPGTQWRPQGPAQVNSMPPDARAAYELAQEKAVFGEFVQHDAKGRPIEVGIGSKARMTSSAVAALKKDQERQAMLRTAMGLKDVTTS
jgi:hypothetical protein